MDVEELIARHPRVFHTMSASAWPSVRRHGLLSTRRLVDLFGLDAVKRDRLLGAPRKQFTVLRAPGLPLAVIRDKKSMKFVAEKIDPDSSLTEYLDAINSRVFFWASPERLDRLRQAKEYRTEHQVVLHVDTRTLVERHGLRIELCRLNSGAVTQKKPPPCAGTGPGCRSRNTPTTSTAAGTAAAAPSWGSPCRTPSPTFST
jgi:uncharacterized protein DUF7002